MLARKRGANNVVYSAEEIMHLVAEGRLDKFYNSQEWRRLSKEVIASYHNECQLCAKKKGHRVRRATCTHHVLPLEKFPTYAYEKFYVGIDGERQLQLMPLCNRCHNDVHGRNHTRTKLGFVNAERW